MEKFFDETTYASVCQGLSQRVAFRSIIDEKQKQFSPSDRIDIYSSQLNKVCKTIALSVKSGCLCGLRKGPLTVI